ncbi:MAG TPA: type II toxin-antitoxin system VapC family toxin [Thermoanaerobaculia bacterium]
MILHLDTSFLVDLIREWARNADGPASAFLEEHLDDELRTSLFVACELLLGVERSDRSEQERRRVEKALAVVPVVLPSAGLAPLYGRVLAHLQRRGNAIATMDLLIAGTALVEGAPLVTRNPSHFERVPDLRVLEY